MSNRAGFTLLEVLAAVAILGIAYIALGSSGIQGLQHEGEARRRLQASLLADSVLSELEMQIEEGAAGPDLGQNERETDGFQVSIEVTPFSIDIPEEQTTSGKRLGKARSRLGGSEAQAQAVIPGPSLLGGNRAQAANSPLRKADIRVTWSEGFSEQTVSRTTFWLDADAAAPALEAIGQAQAAARGKQPATPAPNPLGGGESGTIGSGQ